jgi:ferredoxin-type protein NapH
MCETVKSITDTPHALQGEKAKTVSLTWWRRLTQVVALAIIGQWSFYGIFRCPFIVPYVSCQNCPVITCHGRLFTMFWGFWLLIPLSVVFFGRAFCGWACPGGLVNQLLGKVAPLKLRLRNAFTRIAPYGVYFGTAVALYVWLILGQPREAVPIRIGGFFQSVALTFEHANLVWLVRTSFVLGFLALGLLTAGAWCRFACPTGGILEALKSFSFFKVYKNEKCNDCDKCLAICEMGTRPEESNCTNCCDCLSVCPQNAIQVGRPRR